MPKSVKHKFVSAIPDSTDATIVRPSNWNDEHDLTDIAASGANSDITSLSGITGAISSPDYIAFDTTYATPLIAGQLGWDGNNTLAIGMAGGNVIQHIGEDQFIYIKADAAITKGQVIMFTGAVGASGVLTGAPAIGVTNPQYIMGVAAENLAHNDFGLIQTFGELTGLNTNAFNEGDVLYYDSAVTGGLTSTFPTNGPIVTVASVAKKSGGNGVLVIRVSVTQRITAGTGATITQALTGTTVAVTSPYNPASVDITGGTINGTTIGATTPSTVNATTITGQTGVLRGTGTNLVLQSQTFDNASWTKSQTSVSATLYTDPLGGTTANNLIEAATTAIHFAGGTVSVTSGINYTFSVYLKKGIGATAPDWIQLTFGFSGFGTSPFVNFNLATGLVGTASSVVSSSITFVGNDWYRCSITATSTSTSSGNLGIIAFTNNSNSGRLPNYAGAITSDVLVWGAQIEVGSTLNTYIPTTTTAVYGTPTLSFSGVSSIGLLSNGALYLQPAGTGALQAQATTSTTAGGNARGANAVDWQTNRSAAGQVASATYSVVSGGSTNTASNTVSTVSGGFINTASAYASNVAGGQSNTSSGQYSVISGGASNTSAGVYNFIGGGFTNAGTALAAVTTQSGTMNATTAVTLSGSNASIRVGQYIIGTSIAGDTYVAAISGTSLTLSKNASGSSTSTLSFFTPHGVVVGGGNNQATGSYSFIGGGGDAGTAANRNVASGDWSFVGGGQANQATAIGAVVAGGGLSTNASANGNTASAICSFVGSGGSNTTSGTYAFIGAGFGNAANAVGSAVLGGYRGSARSIQGNQVFSACIQPIASSAGVSQAALLVLGVETTDATATALRSNTSAAGTTNQVILPNNSAYFFRGEVISGKTAGGDTKGWTIEGVIKRGANAASTALVGVPTVTSTYADAGASTWVIAVTADTTNGGIRVTFTGQAATTIRTVCQIRTTEMTF